MSQKEDLVKEEALKDDELKKEILVRLRRVEGQVKGIQGMIDKDICCRDVLTQIAAIKAAINKVGILMIEDYARNCMGIEEGDENYPGLERLIKTLNSFVK
ncbi:metal-sensitive transcriptional regulator [Clostridium massiliamazoniense]|uniref:metal-sensitive transcriptional regulator n=1 Tax=Clostridium massiliamazoniense TaxID=1347366 RepID=UPI0006D82BB8|nr:metal-sensitive transcriptional regulator [Clostridium massiliamazoniense]